MLAKPSSSPPMYSATATLASLPDWMTMPRSRSSSFTVVPSRTNIFEPPVRHALTLIGTSSAKSMRPAAISAAAT